MVKIDIIDDDPDAPAPRRIYAATMRDRALGRAGSWLLDDLRARISVQAEGGDRLPDRSRETNSSSLFAFDCIRLRLWFR